MSAEAIRNAARKCRFCGHMIDVQNIDGTVARGTPAETSTNPVSYDVPGSDG
jgi:hypothetical protein